MFPGTGDIRQVAEWLECVLGLAYAERLELVSPGIGLCSS
jgi:hypothetical protein